MNSSGYLRTWSIATLLLLVCSALTNMVMDPYGLWGFPPFDRLERL